MSLLKSMMMEQGLIEKKSATKAVQKGFISEEEKAKLSDNEIY